MAVSDFIIQNSASNAAQTYVPAGTDVMMLIGFSNGGSGSSEIPSFNTSVGYSEMMPPNIATGTNSTNRGVYDYAALKIPIDNTHSIRVPASGTAAATIICMVQVA